MVRQEKRSQKVVRSHYLQVIRLRNGNYLCVNAFARTRMVVRPRVKELIDLFDTPRSPQDATREFLRTHAVDADATLACVQELVAARLLHAGSPASEERAMKAWLSQFFARDPDAGLDDWVRATPQQQDDYWALSVGRDIESLQPLPHQLTAIVLGACDVQMETDVLRHEARRYGIDLTLLSTFEDDAALVQERRHDFVIVGALQARFDMLEADATGAEPPHRLYAEQARRLLGDLRRMTRAPILIDNLPVPTCSPLGLADRGVESHRERVRRANMALVELASELDDVFVVDVDAALSLAGKGGLLDDSLVSFAHLGALGWLAQRGESERRAVHGIFPPLEQLSALGSAGPFAHERLMAAEHLGVMLACLGIGRRKCVVVDLDDTLWPGVLAETGAPFAWAPEVSGQFSFVGLYFGLHEALKALARRGILLACASKNDEHVVRRLWRYPPQYPVERLLTLDDFVTHRINWNEKADNIADIADELNLGLDSLVFIDDSAVERAKVQQYLPELLVLGENPFTTRLQLLTSPALQVPRITEEARQRAPMMRAQLARQRAARSAVDQAQFNASLELACDIRRVESDHDLDRIHELVVRTNQFNTSGRRYRKQDLHALAQSVGGRIYAMSVKDRFADYGLVAACICEEHVIELVAMSCRVIGLGVENTLLRFVVEELCTRHGSVEGRLIATERNLPARNLFGHNGFSQLDDTTWRLACRS
jgi:FkbH-like protein